MYLFLCACVVSMTVIGFVVEFRCVSISWVSMDISISVVLWLCHSWRFGSPLRCCLVYIFVLVCSLLLLRLFVASVFCFMVAFVSLLGSPLRFCVGHLFCCCLGHLCFFALFILFVLHMGNKV